eukprot:675167-Rhodomonas_salina.1
MSGCGREREGRRGPAQRRRHGRGGQLPRGDALLSSTLLLLPPPLPAHTHTHTHAARERERESQKSALVRCCGGGEEEERRDGGRKEGGGEEEGVGRGRGGGGARVARAAPAPTAACLFTVRRLSLIHISEPTRPRLI